MRKKIRRNPKYNTKEEISINSLLLFKRPKSSVNRPIGEPIYSYFEFLLHYSRPEFLTPKIGRTEENVEKNWHTQRRRHESIIKKIYIYYWKICYWLSRAYIIFVHCMPKIENLWPIKRYEIRREYCMHIYCKNLLTQSKSI